MAEQAIKLSKTKRARIDQVENRRSFSNALVRPKYSVGFLNYFVVSGIIAICVVIGFVYMRLMEIDRILNAPNAMAVGGHIPVYDAFTDVTTIAILGLALFVIYACVMAIILSHRVAGPMTALTQYIEEIKRGNYDFDRQLRKKDELHPIYGALRDLARSLKENAKSESARPLR